MAIEADEGGKENAQKCCNLFAGRPKNKISQRQVARCTLVACNVANWQLAIEIEFEFGLELNRIELNCTTRRLPSCQTRFAPRRCYWS